MTRTTYHINILTTYDPTRAGAHWSINGGQSWLNNGQFTEAVYKACMGLSAVHDANGRFDLGDDVPETGESVKSPNCTLTSVNLGESYEEIKTNYFQRVHSTAWAWVVIDGNKLTAYRMNKAEFAEFMDKWHSAIDKSRKTLRFKKDSEAMRKWLDRRLRA